MSIQYGEDFNLYVRTATGPEVWTVVNDINRFGKRSNRNTSSFPVFNRSTAYSIPGAREQTFTVAGYLNPTDPGQMFIRAAEQANTDVFIRVVPTDGVTQGFEQQCRVGSSNYDATPEGLQEWGFELSGVADPTAYGTPGVVV